MLMPSPLYPALPSRSWLRLIRSPSAWTGGAIVAAFLLVALAADWLAPYRLDQAMSVENIARRPTADHWLGTDELGKDVLSRVMFGSRLSLSAGLLSILLAVVLGTPIGAIAGYFGGRLDSLLMRAIDVALAFPSVLIALLVSAAYGPSWAAVVIAVGLINVPVFARQVRATVLSVAQLDYVLASRAFGASWWHVVTREILPSLISPVVVLASLSLGTAILEVAGLSFLGLGGDQTIAEWGAMLTRAKTYWNSNAWLAIGPGAAISLTVLGFNLLGDGLRDALDPRSEATLL
ncbi:MAG: ABC transporter permease [Planctomycetaceae bacterium]|nr:ABC transporter permease [Planctomycetaceae bacterium]